MNKRNNNYLDFVSVPFIFRLNVRVPSAFCLSYDYELEMVAAHDCLLQALHDTNIRHTQSFRTFKNTLFSFPLLLSFSYIQNKTAYFVTFCTKVVNLKQGRLVMRHCNLIGDFMLFSIFLLCKRGEVTRCLHAAFAYTNFDFVSVVKWLLRGCWTHTMSMPYLCGKLRSNNSFCIYSIIFSSNLKTKGHFTVGRISR